ncbi:hypothetical protein [Natronospora cellulosivora (SeqCode)]
MKTKMLLTGRESGATLIEILIVIILIAVASAVVIPSFGGLRDTLEINSLQRQVDRGFNLVRRAAINSGQKEIINIVNNTIQISLSNGDNIEIDLGELSLESEEEIIYNPDGSSSGGKISFLYKQDRYYYEINPITGKTGWYR